MLLSEAKEILEKNGYILESEEISIDDLIAFAKLNCSKAMGAAVSVKDRCEWPLVEIDITGDAVFKKYNGTCITGYFKERTGAGARRGASKYFSIFPEESKLVVGPGTSERVNGKLCRLITNEYTYNSWDDLIKFFNRNNFNTTKLPKTFSEAKEILKKNGYRLVEDTDDSEGMSLRDKLAMAKKFNDGPAPAAKPAIKWTSTRFYNAIVDAVKARGLKAKRDLNCIIVRGVGDFGIDVGDDLMYRAPEDVGRMRVYVNGDEQDFEVFNFDMQDLQSCIDEIADFICNYDPEN